jgi:hypothetical protein
MKVRKAAFAALPLLVPLLLLPASANASALEHGSGSYTATGQVISVRQVDGNTVITATEVETLTGTLSGTRRATGVEIIHPDGTFVAHDSGTFTGAVDGRTGSIVISGASSGAGDTGSGRFAGEHGTGGLAGLHLRGPFQVMMTGPTTSDGTYSIQFRFGS